MFRLGNENVQSKNKYFLIKKQKMNNCVLEFDEVLATILPKDLIECTHNFLGLDAVTILDLILIQKITKSMIDIIHNYLFHEDEIILNRNLIVIVGRRCSGKTTCLEYLLLGKSNFGIPIHTDLTTIHESTPKIIILEDFMKQDLDDFIYNLRHSNTKLYITCQIFIQLPRKYRMHIDHLFVLDGMNQRLRESLSSYDLPQTPRFLLNMVTDEITLLPDKFFS